MAEKKLVTVTAVSLVEGPVFMEPTEDGMQDMYYISVAVPDDRDPNVTWIHNHSFRAPRRYQAGALAGKILGARNIDVNNGWWTRVDARDQPTLEERFELYAIEEQMQRAGYHDFSFGGI